MAGDLNIGRIKIGDSATTSQNFYIRVPTPEDGTLIIERENGTAILTIDANGYLKPATLPNYANDSAAATGGVPVGGLYRNGSVVQVRVS